MNPSSVPIVSAVSNVCSSNTTALGNGLTRSEGENEDAPTTTTGMSDSSDFREPSHCGQSFSPETTSTVITSSSSSPSSSASAAPRPTVSVLASSYRSNHPQKISPDLSFPWRLFLLLNDASSHNFQHIISWTDHGTAFQIKDTSQPLEEILGQYFKTSKYVSFRRQLLNYGFVCVSKKDRKFVHPDFLRDKPQGCDRVEYLKKDHKLAAASVVNKKGQTIQHHPTPEEDEFGFDQDMEPIPLHLIRNVGGEKNRTQHDTPNMEIKRPQPTSWSISHHLPNFRTPVPKYAFYNMAALTNNNNNNSNNNDNTGSSSSSSSLASTINTHNSPPDVSTFSSAAPHSPQEFDAIDLEPRTILEMKIQPNTTLSVASIIYNLCPSLSTSQQLGVEFTTQFFISGGLYKYQATHLAMVVSSIFLVFHTVEILSTDFSDTDDYAPSRKPTKKVLGIIPQFLTPVEHSLIDNLWMQMIFSAFFFFPQQLGGPNWSFLAILYIMTQPLSAVVSLKTHLKAQMQRRLKHNRQPLQEQQQQQKHAVCEYHFGRLIIDCLVSYGIGAVLLYHATREIQPMQHDGDNDTTIFSRHNHTLEGVSNDATMAMTSVRWMTSQNWIPLILFYMNCLPTVFGARYMQIWRYLVSPSRTSVSHVDDISTPPVTSSSTVSKTKIL
ncbi:HSF-type DNA-binding protein [Nitzschia inconspicua]|uniref:HSF-type DNA-binding protein n=1 Tax=Nitzschia inconspicua TaxID=303405 RepID=A0A9K3K639_9STRA|nr:HSF-type DNA-binding protein [Nitzschia inconspicua]